MSYAVKPLTERGYRYIPHAFQYSSGVQALPGFQIHRIRFNKLLPMAQGFAWIAAFLKGKQLSLTAFVACELRSPLPFTPDGFVDFNKGYADTLRAWGIFAGDDNPVARSNVCPEIDPPAEPCFYAFSYVAPEPASNSSRQSFVISGGAETLPGKASMEEAVVAYRDVSADGLRRKSEQTFSEISARLAAFDLTWADTSAVHAYTIFDFSASFMDVIVRGGAAANGLVWYPCRPPVRDVDFEMDCRGPASDELVHP